MIQRRHVAFKKQEAVLLLLRDNQVIIRLANSDNTALCHQLRLTIVWCTSVESTPVSADTILVCDNHSTAVSLASLGPSPATAVRLLSLIHI